MIKWCNICNVRPAQGVLTLLDKTTNELMNFDACTECVRAIHENKVDWIEDGIER